MLEAATEGARLRFRPVMMTSFAFILGLYPLVVASGASQLARRDVGTPVFGGMILASFVGIFAIPPLYVMFQAIRERLRPGIAPAERARACCNSAEFIRTYRGGVGLRYCANGPSRLPLKRDDNVAPLLSEVPIHQFSVTDA